MGKKQRWTTLVVQKFRGELVFSNGSLRLDRLIAVYLGGDVRREEKFRVLRDGTLFDTGKIEEIGTHGASDRFVDFDKIVPKEARFAVYTSTICDPLFAKWFLVGDVIQVPCGTVKFRTTIVEWYRSDRQFAPKFAKAMKSAWAEERRLSAISDQKFEKRHGVSIHDVWESRSRKSRKLQYELHLASRRIGNTAFRDFYRALRRERLPSVIRFRRYRGGT